MHPQLLGARANAPTNRDPWSGWQKAFLKVTTSIFFEKAFCMCSVYYALFRVVLAADCIQVPKQPQLYVTPRGPSYSKGSVKNSFWRPSAFQYTCQKAGVPSRVPGVITCSVCRHRQGEFWGGTGWASPSGRCLLKRTLNAWVCSLSQQPRPGPCSGLLTHPRAVLRSWP